MRLRPRQFPDAGPTRHRLDCMSMVLGATALDSAHHTAHITKDWRPRALAAPRIEQPSAAHHDAAGGAPPRDGGSRRPLRWRICRGGRASAAAQAQKSGA